MLMIANRSDQPPAGPTLAEELCAAAGIGPLLDEALLRGPDGEPFEPATITLGDDPAALPEQLALLARPEPVGGAERLVRANERRVAELFEQRLRQRLLADGGGARASVLLGELRDLLRRFLAALSERKAGLDAEFEQIQADLHGWQSASRSRPGLLRGLAAWLIGSADQLALPQAVALANEREQVALRRLGAEAAVRLVSRLAEDLGLLLERRQAAAASARSGAAEARRRGAELTRRMEQYAPWSWRSDVDQIAARLAQQADLDALAERLLAALGGADGDADLAGIAAAIGAAEAERMLAGLGAAQLLEAEAAGADLGGEDPLVLVGRHLLASVDQQPGWRLARAARPRVETVQVTADGAPLFRLEGLQSAGYGLPVHRFGFLQAELEIAPDELALPGDPASFARALTQRNFFVTEELAAAWAPTPSPHAGRGPEPLPASTAERNGAAPGEELPASVAASP